MKSAFRYIFFIISILTLSGLSREIYAQENNSEINSELIDPTVDIANLKPEFYTSIVLPPLSVFLETAENGSRVNLQKAKKEEEEGSLIKIEREWMSSIRAFGNYQYGALGANVMNATTAGQTLQYSSQVQSIYNGGIAFTLPLDIIWDRKNRIRTQQARIKQSDYQIKQALEELKIEISEFYLVALQQLNTLKVRSESVTIANSDIKMSEANFLNGHLTLSEYSYRKSMQATAITNYEATKAELNKAILHLELLTNIKILKK